ncbi:alpha/beta hydrolase fold domain-containing protein [Kordiimonas sp.]|uniref:alpha/beta hydrolase fold domain-containing protein n=1 Tax=Kordiimonas sp. TaxID=1970157 RepID=UPI003A8DF0C7
MSTPSKEARAFLESLPPFEERPFPPEIGDFSAWAAWQAHIEKVAGERSEKTIQDYYDQIKPVAFKEAGGLEIAEITPTQKDKSVPPLIFLHGGAYVGFSARSSLFATIPLAIRLGTTVTSVCYPLAPQSSFQSVVPAAAKTIISLMKPGFALMGDSAGGGLAISVTQYMKRMKERLPASLVLSSPWVDLTASDRIDDPILRFKNDLEVCARAYAADDAKNPMASPLYDTFTGDFPRVLTQMGEREIFVSSVEAFHTKLTSAGIVNVLKVYDGMYHSFPVLTPEVPESVVAFRQLKSFLKNKHMNIGPNNDPQQN